MKLKVLLVVLLGLVGCNTTYPSQRQAFTACKEWESDEKTVKWKHVPSRGNLTGWVKTDDSRRCVVESETNQVLGLMNQVIEDDEWVEDENEGEKVVVKNFRY